MMPQMQGSSNRLLMVEGQRGPLPPILLRRPRLITADFDRAVKGKSSNSGVDSTHCGTGVFFDNTELSSNALLQLQREVPPVDHYVHRDPEDDDDDDDVEFDLEDEDEERLDFTTNRSPLPEVEFHNHEKKATVVNDVTTFSKALGHWKPFVDRVAKFMERERFPFEYVDIWVLDQDQRGGAGQVLRHVGHATNPNTELCCIMTMYHMNQFGDNSEKYVFPPGVGLPGRVLARGEPVWDDKLPCTKTFRDFPRTQLARKHGVRKGLGIPLALPCADGNSKQAIVVMYTTNEEIHLHDNRRLLDITYNEFQRRTPPAIVSDGMVEEMDVDDDDEVQEDAYIAILPCNTEVEMANILREDNTDDSLSLQCLLWRAPCRRTLQENKRIDALKEQYLAFQKKHEVAAPLAKGEVAEKLVVAWEELLSTGDGDESNVI